MKNRKVLLAGISIFIFIYIVISVFSGIDPADFCQDYYAAFNALHHYPIYSQLPCIKLPYDAHPPSSVFIFIPFLLMPLASASMVWSLFSYLAYLASGMGILYLLKLLSLRTMTVFVAFSMIWPALMIASITHNIIQLLLLLLVISWILRKKNYTTLAGIVMGIAALIKIWPLIFLIGDFLLDRKRVALPGILTYFVGTLVTVCLLGSSVYKDYFGPIQAYEGKWINNESNFSLSSALVKLMQGGHSQSTQPLAVLAPNNIELLVGYGISMLLIIFVLYFIYRYRKYLKYGLLADGILITVMFLAFPISWEWSLVILLVPLAVIFKVLNKCPRQPIWWYSLFIAGCFSAFDPRVIMHGFRSSNIVSILITTGVFCLLLCQISLLLRLAQKQIRLPRKHVV